MHRAETKLKGAHLRRRVLISDVIPVLDGSLQILTYPLLMYEVIHIELGLQRCWQDIRSSFNRKIVRVSAPARIQIGHNPAAPLPSREFKPHYPQRRRVFRLDF